MGNIRTWLEGVSSSVEETRESSERPADYSDDDVERVMRQISLAVSRSRGVSSLSRAVAKERF